MGASVSADCMCGYSDELRIGAGAADAGSVCYWPAVCSQCRKLVAVDRLASGHQCPDCGASVELLGDATVNDWVQDIAVESSGHALAAGPHACPVCDRNRLLFSPGSLAWD